MFNIKNILVVFALAEESNNLFNNLDNINLLYTGVGKVNATYNLTKKIIELKQKNQPIDAIINLGSCGSSKFKKKELVLCNKFIQMDMDATIFNYKVGETPAEKHIPYLIEHKKILNNLPFAICGTKDNFATEKSSIEEIDVIDMEAYALAKVCFLEKINFISIKCISDNLDENGGEDWDTEIKSIPEILFNYFKTII